MEMCIDLPKGFSVFEPSSDLIRTAAVCCNYEGYILVYGGSISWIKDEEYRLCDASLLLYDPKSNTIVDKIKVEGVKPSMNAAMFYDGVENKLYILASAHSTQNENSAWIVDMKSMKSKEWKIPNDAQFFTSEAWGYDSVNRKFYTFHLAGDRKNNYQVLYRYDVDLKQWNKINIPLKYQKRVGSGGVFVSERNLFFIHGGYYWDNTGKPFTLHENLIYYPESDKWERVECGEQIGSSQSCLHYDTQNDRIIIIPGSPNGVSLSHQAWMYMFFPVKPRAHCDGSIKALFSLPITLGIRNLSFIFDNSLYIIGGSRDNQTLEYALRLELNGNTGLDILG